MTQEDLTRAPVIIELNGVEYRLLPISDLDISELDRWVKAKYIQTARDSLTSDCTADEREETLTLAMKTASNLSWMSGLGAGIIATPDGLARILWQAAQTHHKGISYEVIRSAMFNAANVRKMKDALTDLRPKLPDGFDTKRKRKSSSKKGSRKRASTKR